VNSCAFFFYFFKLFFVGIFSFGLPLTYVCFGGALKPVLGMFQGSPKPVLGMRPTRINVIIMIVYRIY